MLERGEERVLHQVIGIVALVQHANGERVRASDVPRHQAAERLPITAPDLLDELSVRRLSVMRRPAVVWTNCVARRRARSTKGEET